MTTPLFYTEFKKLENGTVYQIIDVQGQEVSYSKPIDNIMTLSNELSIELRKNLISGNEIKIMKNVFDEKESHNLSIEDFTIIEPDTLEKYKNKMMGRLYTSFSSHFASLGGLALFEFFVSYSTLADSGYYITDENRESKYLEIINTGDDNLISALEIYLERYDGLSPLASYARRIKNFKIDTSSAKTIEEVNEAVDRIESLLS